MTNEKAVEVLTRLLDSTYIVMKLVERDKKEECYEQVEALKLAIETLETSDYISE